MRATPTPNARRSGRRSRLTRSATQDFETHCHAARAGVVSSDAMRPKSIDPRDPNWTLVAAFSTLSLVLGFAYGDEWAREGFHLKDWQPLLAAFVAAVAIIAAWTMARRSLRFNAISREEDRIEESLPALRETTEWLSQIAFLLQGMEDRHQTAFALESFVKPTSPMRDQIAEAIPLADDQMVQRIAGALLKLYAAAQGFNRVERELEDLRVMIGRSRPTTTEADREASVVEYANRLGKSHVVAALDKSRAEFLALCAHLEARRVNLESRLVRIRAEIERYISAE